MTRGYHASTTPIGPVFPTEQTALELPPTPHLPSEEKKRISISLTIPITLPTQSIPHKPRTTLLPNPTNQGSIDQSGFSRPANLCLKIKWISMTDDETRWYNTIGEGEEA
jgi:hypothetical protein